MKPYVTSASHIFYIYVRKQTSSWKNCWGVVFHSREPYKYEDGECFIISIEIAKISDSFMERNTERIIMNWHKNAEYSNSFIEGNFTKIRLSGHCSCIFEAIIINNYYTEGHSEITFSHFHNYYENVISLCPSVEGLRMTLERYIPEKLK